MQSDVGVALMDFGEDVGRQLEEIYSKRDVTRRRALARALRELHRAPRPGGRAVVRDVDWTTLSWHSSDGARMARVLDAWGFDAVRMEGHAFPTNEPSDETYGGAFLPVIEDFVRGLDDVPDAEIDAWAVDQRELGARGECFFSVTQFCFAAGKPR